MTPPDSSFPGPAALGRSVVIGDAGRVPDAATGWPVVRVERAGDPSLVAELDRCWRSRTPVVIELAVPFGELKQPERSAAEPYELPSDFSFLRERLHFVVWANSYDARDGQVPRWHHARRALALGAHDAGVGDDGDVLLPGGAPAWIDGGPRQPLALPVLHVNQLWAGLLRVDGFCPPAADLAADQLAAVSHGGGAARIIAPAGSGKTRVLTERYRHLVADRGWAPGAITAVAYNKRAAEEMRSRLAGLPTTQLRTLHALGYAILRHGRPAPPDLIGEREVRHEIERLVDVRPRANTDVYAPYIEALGTARLGLVEPAMVEEQRDDVPGFATFFPRYREQLARRGVIDFDEQIYGALIRLLREPEVRSHFGAQCRHLLVDEMQDLTPAQLLLVRLLAAPAFDVFGVGDDDQTIYSHAGANPDHLISYERWFPGAAHYALEVNYRCAPAIVDAAGHLLSYNRVRVPKAIRAGRTDAAADALRLVRAPAAALGPELVEAIRVHLGNGTRAAADLVVLTRVNASLLAPRVLLAEAGLPFHLDDDVTTERLLHRTGTAAALAWMRLAVAVAAGDRIVEHDLAAAFHRPPRRVRRELRDRLTRRCRSWEQFAARAAGLAPGDGGDRALELVTDVERLARRVGSGVSTADLLVEIRDRVGLGRVMRTLDQSKGASGASHLDDLDALVQVAFLCPEPARFESWLGERLAVPSAPGGVRLSTVHRVKGLEWPHVLIWGAADGLFPHHLSITDEQREEERRIFHVAITRAIESATVFVDAGRPSPFIDELTGAAPRRPARRVRSAAAAGSLEGALSASLRAAGEAVVAAEGLALEWAGYQGVVVDVREGDALLATGSGAKMAIRFGERVTVDGRRARLVAPGYGPDPAALEALKAWRAATHRAEKVPAYVVANDACLTDIATRRPADLDELAACHGIGPSKLERYGDAILAALDDALGR